jgi:hypothetical protein
LRFNVTSATTLYFVAFAGYTSGTAYANGFMRARRAH